MKEMETESWEQPCIQYIKGYVLQLLNCQPWIPGTYVQYKIQYIFMIIVYRPIFLICTVNRYQFHKDL